MKMYLTIGLPASGKTTWAKRFLSEHPEAVRANRDDLREMMFSSRFSGRNEKMVTEVQEAICHEALEEGRTVIVDDTNLNPKTYRRLRELGLRHGAAIVDINFTDVPLEECLKRDALREKSVGQEVILRMYNKYLEMNK